MSIVGVVLAVVGTLGACVCVAIGLLVVGVLVWWAFTPAEYEIRMAEDRKDPKKAWIQGVGLLLMDTGDYAYLNDGMIQVMLEDAWGIKDADALFNTVADLEGRRDEVAWNLARAILLLRAGVSVGYLDNDASWARCRALGLRLQEVYRSWDAMAEDLVVSRRRWKELPEDGSDDSEDMEEVTGRVTELKADLWKKVAWAQALE
jgi:hypothetical protein